MYSIVIINCRVPPTCVRVLYSVKLHVHVEHQLEKITHCRCLICSEFFFTVKERKKGRCMGGGLSEKNEVENWRAKRR